MGAGTRLACHPLRQSDQRLLRLLKSTRTRAEFLALFPGFGERTMDAALEGGLFTKAVVERIKARLDELVAVAR